MSDRRMGLQIEPFGNGEAEEMHDELVRPEMRRGEAEAAFGVFDSGHSLRVLCWCKVCILNRSYAFLYHDIIRFFGLAREFFVQENIERPGQSEVAVNVLFFDKLLDCLDMSNFMVRYLGGSFQAVFFDVVGHAEVDFWSQMAA